MEPENRICQNCKASFTIDLESLDFYKKIAVPLPTWCPACRRLRRLGWMGHQALYKRKCDYTKQDIISFYHPDSPHTIYRQDIWWSDKWDSKEYGKEYDFSRPFFDQFEELFQRVPLPALHTDYATCVNSDYVNGALRVKNCYLCFGINDAEDCSYLINATEYMKDCLDGAYSTHSELCYEIVNSHKSSRLFYSSDCDECHDVYFSRDLVGCSYCIGCANLRSKSYCIFNKQVSKEEFESYLKGLNLGSFSEREKMLGESKKFLLSQPVRNFRGRRNENSSGDYIYNSKNVRNSFMVDSGENIRYSQFLKAKSANCEDYSFVGSNAELIYESVWVSMNTASVKFSFWNYGARDLEYCFGCHSSANCFGCVGLRKAEYCILNKQYSKEEYFDLVDKIKKQMSEMPYVDSLGRIFGYGEFFPLALSPWTYNESTGNKFFPLVREQAEKMGFRWRVPDAKEYSNATAETPDDIAEVSDDILQEVIKCEDCGRNYRLIRAELEFYRRLQIPVPRKCPFCRNTERLKKVNSMDVYKRSCAKCGKEIETSYAPDQPEIVYCEQCYQAEVV